MPPGEGISGGRLIKSICECIGIKDLAVTIEGSDNKIHVTKAFFLGLMRQRTHQVIVVVDEPVLCPRVLNTTKTLKTLNQVWRQLYLTTALARHT